MLRTLYRLLPEPSRRGLIALTAWLVAAAILQGITLGLVGIVITALLSEDPATSSWMIALGGSVVAFLIVQWQAQMVAFRSDTALALHLRLGSHLAQLPLGWFTPTRQAQVIDLATTGVPQSMSYPAILLRPAITAIVTPIAAALTIGLLDWRYTLATVAATGAAWFVSRGSDRLARTVDARRHQVGAEATRRILEYATLQPVVRTDQRPTETNALDHALTEVRRASLRSAVTVIPGLLAFSLTLNICFAGMIGLGIAWISGATLTIATFLGVIVVIARLTAVAAAGAELAAGLRLQRGILERLATVLDTPPLPSSIPAQSSAPAQSIIVDENTLLRAEHLSFGYDDTLVLEDVSFTLPRRGLTAVVGASGAGKTTLARLLVRFWDPTSGHILLDGHDIRSVPPQELAGRLATVLQDDYLLDTSFRDNIRLGKPEADDAEIARVLSATGLTDVVAGLPFGLDTPVGPGGARLSGGQRQRVCVARALLKAAPLTLMDEATSALDPENARLIRAAARRLANSGSVLLVTHNLDSVIYADQILVLDEGRLVQHGTFGELRSHQGKFRSLIDARQQQPRVRDT
ncbi:ABC transporter ATP-binding protein [Microbacterium sp.]|uniref:ABC transporter ATP-binding protein n=1 Tax=Microbacterium sp. TaxID=51671 RepID=UPI003F98E4C4